jgi:hypothetical protein
VFTQLPIVIVIQVFLLFLKTVLIIPAHRTVCGHFHGVKVIFNVIGRVNLGYLVHWPPCMWWTFVTIITPEPSQAYHRDRSLVYTNTRQLYKATPEQNPWSIPAMLNTPQIYTSRAGAHSRSIQVITKHTPNLYKVVPSTPQVYTSRARAHPSSIQTAPMTHHVYIQVVSEHISGLDKPYPAHPTSMPAVSEHTPGLYKPY